MALLLTGFLTAQAVVIWRVGGGPTRALSLILALLALALLSARIPRARRLTGLWTATGVATANFAIHTSRLAPDFPDRILHVAVLASAAVLFLGAALTAMSRRRGVSWGLAISLGAALIAAEARLESKRSDLITWTKRPTSHPILREYNEFDSRAATVYPDDPRRYFGESRSLTRWRFELHHPDSAARLVRNDERPEWQRVEIDRLGDPASFNIQLNLPDLSVRTGNAYRLTFRARADAPRRLAMGVAMNHAPWQNLGMYDTVALDQEWQTVDRTFSLQQADDNARVHFDLGGNSASVELDAVVLVRMPDREPVEPANVREPKIDYAFNHLGCRGPDVSITPPSEVSRILLLGDSYALGVGVHERDTLAALLQSLSTADRARATPIEVVNCAVSGYSTADARRFYETLGAALRPDVVLLVMTDTDDRPASDEEEAGGIAPRDDLDRFLLTARALRAWFNQKQPAYSAMAQEVVQLDDELRAQGARLGVVFFRSEEMTSRWQTLIDTVTESMRPAAVPLLDLGPALLANHSALDLYVHGVDHRPNNIAHRIAAEEVSRFLDQHELRGYRRPRGPERQAGASAGEPASKDIPPLVIAHRGASRDFPESTLESIRAALDMGADVVEVDVRLTRDAVPVIAHDGRLERTTNGTGLVQERTLAELKALDAGSWKDPKFRGATIPTLEEAVMAVRGRGSLLLDMKVDGCARLIADIFRRTSTPQQNAFIGAWTRGLLAEFAYYMPNAHILQTRDPPSNWTRGFFDQARSDGAWGLEVGDEVPPGFMESARAYRLPVIRYTVNDEPTMRRLLESNVAGIETDDPVLLVRVAKGLGRR